MSKKIIIPFLSGVVLTTALVSGNAHAVTPLVNEAQPGLIDRMFGNTDFSPLKQDDAEVEGLEDYDPDKEEKKAAVKEKSFMDLENVIFDGNNSINDKELKLAIKEYYNKPLTTSSLATLKHKIKKAYFKKGYVLVRIVTPPQHFSDGKLVIYKVKKGANGKSHKITETIVLPKDVAKSTLAISVYEAEIGNVTVKNDALNSRVANSIIKQIKKGDVVREKNVESAVSDLNDLNDIKATLNLKPGQEFNTTDFDLTIKSVNEDVNYVMVNNYGSELTGKNMVLGHLEYSNLFKLGEKFSLDAYQSEDELTGGRVSFATPISISNIQLETSYLYSENEIGGRLANIRASGTTSKYTVAFSSKVLNTRKEQTTLRLGYENRVHKSFLNKVDNNKDNLRKFYINGSHLHRDAVNTIFAAATVAKGFDIFGASNKGETSASRVQGDQEAIIFKPVLVGYVRPFNNKQHVFKLSARGQLSSSALLSSDLFAVGGYGSVRGFAVAQESAEKGYSFSAEYNHQLPNISDKFQLKAGPFVDGAAVYNKVGKAVDDRLYSVGFGIELTAQILPQDTTLRFDWAHPVGSYNSSRIGGETLYLSLKQDF